MYINYLILYTEIHLFYFLIKEEKGEAQLLYLIPIYSNYFNCNKSKCNNIEEIAYFENAFHYSVIFIY